MEHRKHLSVRIYKFFRSAVALMCAVAILFTVTPASIAYAEDADDSYDMEAVANSLGTIMSLGSTPTKEGIVGITPLIGIKNEDNDTSRCGNAGLTLAFTSKPSSIGQWIASKISNSSMSYDYGSLMKLSDGNGNTTPVVYHYAVYGHALQQLGLDKVSYNVGGNAPITRRIMGYGAFIIYLFASAVDGLFTFAIHVLQLMNPFAWLDNVARDASKNAGAQYSTVADNTSMFGLGKLMQYIAGIYSTCCNLSWGFIIPMMLAFYLAGMFLFKKTSGGKRLIKRILFIAIGVPLIGSTYTSFLYNIEDLFGTGSSYADKVVASIFVDFESWAVSSHLSPPRSSDKITVKVPINSNGEKLNTNITLPAGGTVTNDVMYNIKEICLEINKASNSLSGVSDDNLRDGFTFDETMLDDATFDSEVSDASTVEEADKSEVIDNAKDALQIDESDSKIVDNVNDKEDSTKKWVANLLLRYAAGDTYTAEQFASSIQSRMTDLAISGGNPSSDSSVPGEEVDNSNNASVIIDKMMHATSCYTNFHTYNGADNTLLGTLSSIFSSRPTDDSYKLGENGITGENTGECISMISYKGFSDGNIDYSIFNDGRLICTPDYETDYSIYTYSLDTRTNSYSPYARKKNGNWYSGAEKVEPSTGLSTMSMYNYLNSDFDETEVVVFGGGNAISNGLIKQNHYSVNIVGTGVLSFVYWLDAMIVLACITMLGITYSIGMLTGTIKYTLKVITAMPMAALGSLRHIAKFCGMVVAMVANILVTALMYGVCIEVLLAITDIIESNVFLFSAAAYLGIMSTMMFGNIMVIVIILIITIILTRIRKQTVSSITEWITQVIGKFFEADAHGNPDKPKANIGGKVASGLATGAAMMAGGSMLKGAAAAIGGALSDGGGGGNDGSDDPNGPNGTNGTNGAAGSTIEKENATHASSDKQTGSNTNKDEKTASEKDNQKNASSDKMLSDHSSQQALIDENNSSESDNSTHDAKSSETADHFNAAERSSESAKSESNTTESSSSEQKTSEVLEQAKQADSSGTVDLAAQNVEAAEKVKGDLHDAGDKLKHADFNGAVESVKDGAKDGAGAAAADAIALTTGNTKVASEAGHLTDDAAHDELNAGSAAKALGAAGGVGGGAGTSQLHQSPQSPVGGKKQLGGEGEQKTQRKQLSSSENGETVKSGSKPQQQSHGDGGTKTSTHSARASVGRNTFNANVTNNIAKGNINNVNTTQGGNSVNIQNSIGNKVSNSQQSSGNNVTTNSANSAGRNVQNIQNVTNVNNNSSSVISNSSNANTVGNNVQNIQNITHVSGKTVTNTNDD